MDGIQLHRLGKRLLALAREVTTEAGPSPLTPARVSVLAELLAHPDSPVGALASRTGFAQSHVSVMVAELADQGLVQTVADPADGRRTLVRLTGAARTAILRRAAHPVDAVLARHAASRRDAARATRLLAELAELLLPAED